MDGLGIDTGISLDDLVQTGQFISDALGRPNGSKVRIKTRIGARDFILLSGWKCRQICLPKITISTVTNVYMIFIDNKLVFGENFSKILVF